MTAFKNMSRNLVGAFAMLVAAGILVGLFLLEIPIGNKDVAMMALGAAMTWAGNVVQFHFGSSAGSKDKTDALAGVATGKSDDPVHVETE